jgi:DNA topoisomerase-1
MSSDVDMSTDSEGGFGINGHITANGAATDHANGNQKDSSMSDDDDMPLVRMLTLSNVFHFCGSKLCTTQTKLEPTSPEVRTLKRKKPINNETSSSDDDAPLASSPFKTKSAVVSSGAAATASAVHKKGHSKHKASTAQVSNTDGDYVKDESLGTKLKRAAGKTNGKAKRPPKKKAKQEESDSDLGSDGEADKLPSQKRTGKHMTKMEDSDLEDEDKPIAGKAAKHARKKKAEKEEEASGSDTSKLKKKPAKAKKEKDSEMRSPKKAKSKKQKEEEEAEEVFKWWEAQEAEGDDTVKWQTLEHNGVLFPPPYEPLPKEIKMRYNGILGLLFQPLAVDVSHLGKPVDLPPAAEEVAGFYAAMIETDHAQDKTFNKNFFEDWQLVLKENPPVRHFEYVLPDPFENPFTAKRDEDNKL